MAEISLPKGSGKRLNVTEKSGNFRILSVYPVLYNGLWYAL